MFFDDYAGNVQQNQEKPAILALFSRFFLMTSRFGPVRARWPILAKGSDLHGRPLSPRVVGHEESARGGHHGDAEAGPGVSLGALVRLLEIVERAVHVKRAVADAEQNGGTLGMMILGHDVDLRRQVGTTVDPLPP